MSQPNKSPKKNDSKTSNPINLDGLKSLVSTAIQSSKEAREGKQAIDFEVEESFRLVNKETRKASNTVPNPLVTYNNDEERHMVVAFNWLVKINLGLVTKFNLQAEAIHKLSLLQSNVTRVEKQLLKCEEAVAKVEEVEVKLGEVESKVEDAKTKVEKTEEKAAKLELDGDKQMQHSLVGTFTISSPDLAGKPSLARKEQVRDAQGNCIGLESHLQTTMRMLRASCGLTFPDADIESVYPIGKTRLDKTDTSLGQSTTWVVKVGNRRPGSTWDELQTGITTGRVLNNKDQFFLKPNSNVYLNNFLTPKRATFLKEVIKPARAARKILNYTVDQWGLIRVRRAAGSGRPWAVVTTKEELQTFISG